MRSKFQSPFYELVQKEKKEKHYFETILIDKESFLFPEELNWDLTKSSTIHEKCFVLLSALGGEISI